MLEKKLKALLKTHNLSLAELAKKVGVPRSTIAQWGSVSDPNVYQLAKVAAHFGISIEELCFDEKPKASSLDELFSEVVISNGIYKIEIKKLVKKDDGEE